MVATYAIDAKKRKAQAQYPHDPPPKVALADALERLTAYRFAPKPGPGTEEAAAFVARFVEDPAARSITPTEDQQEALYAHFARMSDHAALFPVLFAWRGARGAFELALDGGRYAVVMQSPPHGVLVRGSSPLRGWPLKYLLLAVRTGDRSLDAFVRERVRRAPLELAERSALAVLLDDSEWANALIDEWLTQGPISANAAIDWDVVGLLGTTDDEERFRRFFEHASGKLAWAGKNALFARCFDRISAPTLVDVLLPFFEGGLAQKWKSTQLEPFAKALAHVRSEEVARALALGVGEKSVAKVANEYFRAHPDLAAGALEPLAKGKGKVATTARAMVESLGRGTTVDATTTPKPTESALPAVLTSPPWLAKKRPERPRVQLAPIVEDERWSLPAKVHLRAPAEGRSAQRDRDVLKDWSPDRIGEALLFELTDAVALEGLAGRARVHGWGLLHSFYAWLGEPAVPHVIRLLAAELAQGAGYVMLSQAVSPRLAMGCARLALARSGGTARTLALAWLRAHPYEAALGLVPAVLGDDDAEAEVAESALRIVLRNGHAAEVQRATVRYGDEAAAALDRWLARSPYERVPAKMPPKAKWAAPERLGALELTEGGALTHEHAATLIQMLQISPIGEPYAGATDVLARVTAESRARFATALLDEYLLAGSPPSHEWVLGAVALLAPEVAIARLGAHMRAWAADGKVALLHRSLEALAGIGTDDALIVVYDAGQRSRYDDTRGKVRDILEDVARRRELTYEELEDALVPELGLEHGPVVLELGGRTLSVRLGDHLEAELVEDGKRLASFPRKGKSDDAERYAAAKARYGALVEAAESVGRSQVLRFERALRAQRSWRVADLRVRVLPQALVRHVARRLVWQVVETGQLFRVAEDGTLADGDDRQVPYPADDAHVVIAHPLRAPGLATFAAWLDDYEVLQPFAQVHRETFALEPDEVDAVRRVEGRKASYLAVLGLTLGMGWKPVAPGDHGIDGITYALADGRVARLGIRPGLLFGGAQGRPEQTLGALTITQDDRPATFEGLDPLELSELLRDVTLLA